MRKIIFECEQVNVKKYLKARINNVANTPEIYVSGEINVPIDINNLLFSLSKETTCFYSVFTDAEFVIEKIELKGISIELKCKGDLVDIITEKEMKDLLNIVNVYHFNDEIEVKLFESLLSECGLVIFKNKLKINNSQYPAYIAKGDTYFVIKDSIIPISEQEKELLLGKTNNVYKSFIKNENEKLKASI